LRTICYIDGFNFYYGSVKGTPHRWLDFSRMFASLLPKDYQIDGIKFFTARVTGSVKRARQANYWRALNTTPNLEIVLGNFTSHPTTMKLAAPRKDQNPFVQVIKIEEKGSDVNLGTHLLVDGFGDRYDAAVVVTNDSDLKNPMRVVMDDLRKEMWILYPTGQAGSKRTLHPALKHVTTHQRPIRSGVVGASQFPSSINDSKGTFNKPSSW
jgi:hypothetical protein